ncbi:MAG: Omp28-related outer membrane protein [Muribaculaceae bacterium]|nr:Omp28-related outer membrane protein [Muribaculaceae bacterium]
MRKFLLTAAIVAASVAGASALTAPHMANGQRSLKGRHHLARCQEFKLDNRQKMPVLFRAPAEGELSMNWGYCEGAYMAVPFEAGEFTAAVELSADLVSEFAGAKLSSISVANPIDIATRKDNEETGWYDFDNPIEEVTVWLSEDLEGKPLMSATGKMGTLGYAWTTVDLPGSYTVKADTPVYVGYTFTVPENDGNIYPLITDYSYSVYPNSCMLYSAFEGFDDETYDLVFGDEKSWADWGVEFGNLAVRACISGNMLPVNEICSAGYYLPAYTAPGEPFYLQAMVQNLGANTVNSVEYTLTIPGMAPQTYTVDIEPGLEYFEYSDALVAEFVCSTVGNNIEADIRISAINGEKVDVPVGKGYLLCIEEGYPKNNVFEEATGTWCGWCVVGIAGMEYMNENYSEDGFIGIAVHGMDEMDVMGEDQAYAAFGEVVEGFPSAYVNRNMAESVYPDPYEMEWAFEDLSGIPAYAKISAAVTNGEKAGALHLATSVEFADSEEAANYAVGFTVMENGVGPYIQQNYCSGEAYDYYGFEDKPAQIPMMYNDVARNCSKPMGVDGSLPSAIVKGEEYKWETEIELTDVKNPKKVHVVAMVVNKNNGAIENAVCLEAPGYDGVKQISDLSKSNDIFAYGSKGEIRFRVPAAAAGVYTVDGRCVTKNVKGNSLHLPAGVYVVTLDGKACKVVVR